MTATRPDNLPIRYNIELYKGDPLTRMFQIVYTDTSGVAHTLDTTGFDAEFVVRARRDKTLPALFTGTVATGELTTGIQTDGANEWCLLLELTGTDTDTFDAGFVGVYDITMTDTSSREQTFYTGKFSVEGDVA